MRLFSRYSMWVLIMLFSLAGLFVLFRHVPAKGPDSSSGTNHQTRRQSPTLSHEDGSRTGAEPGNEARAPGGHSLMSASPSIGKPVPDSGQEPSGSPRQLPHEAPNIRRVIAEKWVGSKTVGGEPARQRVRIVETDFKYPLLRLEEDVIPDQKTGKEVVQIRRSSVADHLVVGLRHNVGIDTTRGALIEKGYKVRSVEGDSFVLMEMPHFETIEAQDKAVTELLGLHEFIDFAEPDWIVHTSVTPNDPAFTSGKAWSYDNPGAVTGTIYDADIDGPDGWDLRHDASSVIVAVTDTGVRYTHEDLAPNMWTDGSGQFGFDAYDQDYDPMDTNGHGTHVAGIIGARGNNGVGTAGVAWNVQLMALRFIGPSGGTTSDAIRVINYARMNGAHIINASWGGGGFSQGLLNAINACLNADIAVVAAAGNFTRDNDAIPHYPSGYEPPNIVSVASSDASDNLSFFSNYGSTFVDLVAPGADIWSCGIASNSDYQHLSGTSMAAPHVAGALALAKTRYPGESMEDLITRLYNSVDTRPSLNRKVATGGRLNLYRLLADSSPSYLHDDFERPYWFYGYYGYWCYSNARMTRENDEDLFSPNTGQRSMWFRWTAPGDGLVRFKGSASTGDVSVVAFEGVDRYSLVRLADNFRERPTKVSYLYFYARAGRTYTFSVDSRLNAPQIIVGELVHHPINDMWRDAVNLGEGNRLEVFGDNCGATAEPWENTTPHAGVGNGRSVWWKWTPNFSGQFTLSTQSSPIDTVLAVYSGASPNQFVEVASNDDRDEVDWTSEVTLNAVAGTTYHIAVDSYRGGATGDIMLNGYVPGSLFILKHPENKLLRVGDPAMFRVAAAGQGLRYQWEFNGQPIPGAVQPYYNILRIVPQDFGNYRVRISDISSTIVSNTATLAELQISPQIVWQTRSRSISEGSAFDLRVRATGTGNLVYQWFKDDVPIPGETSDQLTLANVNTSHAGNYTVTVGNGTGFTSSDPIAINVYTSPWDGWSYVDPTTQAGQVFAIMKHEGTWVAAARAPNAIRISTSTDGRNWKHDYINPDGTVYNLIGMRLARGNGFWLCAADASGSPNDVVYKSTDLVNWTQHVLPLAAGESVDGSSQMVFHNGHFYLGVYNAIYRSIDGISWTRQQMPSGAAIRNGKLVSDGSRLLVTRSSSQNVYILSNSAGSWQEVDIDPANTTWTSEAYWKNGLFYIYLSNVRYESADGLTWAPSVTTPPLDVDRYARWFLDAGPNKFVDTYDGGNYRFYASSYNGATWTLCQNLTPTGMSVASSDGERIVFGTNLGGLIATENPLTESYPSPMFSGSMVGVGYEGGQFIAQYWNSTLVSADGEHWTTHPFQVIDPVSGGSPVASVPIWIGDEYWQVGASTFPYYRGTVPGAVRLAQVPGLPSTYLAGITNGPSGILSIQIPHPQSYGSLAKSLDDGATWTTVTVPGGSVSRYAKISYKGGHYFYQAYLGNTYASTNLVNWTDLGSVTEVVYHQGQYWVFNNTMSRRSSDLITWSPTVSMPSPGAFDIVSFKGALVGMISGFVSYSYDGVNWVQMDLGFTVSDITTSGSVLLAIGSQGQLAYTGSLPQTAPSVKIIEPVEDTTYLTGSVIPVKVEGYSPDQGGEPLVRLFYDGVYQAERSSPPYEFDLPVGTTSGGHLIHVECRVGGGPVALARKRIVVSPPPSVNNFMGIGGTNSLPGSVARRNGVYISHSLSGMSTSIDGIQWTSTSFPSSLGTVQYTVEGQNRLLAYAGGTKAAVSLDGVNWSGVTLPGTPAVRINFSNGLFWSMTSGGGAMNGMLTSPDGVNWTLRPLVVPPSALTQAIGDPGGTILGLTSSSALWRSSDGGRTWVAITSYTFVSGLSSDGQKFFIKEGNGSSRRVGSSVDGINWTWSPLDSRYTSVILVNGTAFAQDSLGRIFSLSYDGLTWQSVTANPLASTLIWCEDGYFYAKGPNPQGGADVLLRSHNGLDWNYWAPWVTTETVSLIGSEDGIFASTTGGGLWHLPASSTVWVKLFSTRTTTPDFRDFDKNGDTIIAINSAKTLVSSADDGRTWVTVYDPGAAQSSQNNFTTILRLNSVWLAWSPGVRLVRSVDGTTFTDVTSTTGSNAFKTLAHNGSTFAAIRNDGAFMVSSDGLNWSLSAPAGSFPDSNILNLVAGTGGWRALSFGPGTFFPPLKLSTSSDGTAWSQATVTGTYSSGSPVIATTTAGTIAGTSSYSFSSNGSTWANTSANSSVVAFMNAFYQVKNGWIERSVDGVIWVQDRFIGTSFTRAKAVDGTLYLFGSAAFAKLSLNDFAIAHVEAPSTGYAVGETIPVSFVVSNMGSEPTAGGQFNTYAFLSNDGFHGNSDDEPLGTAIVTLPALQPGGSVVLQVPSIIPNQVLPGNYRIGVWFNRDGASREGNSSNNFAMSVIQPVSITGWLLSTSTQGDGVIAQDLGQRMFANGSRVSLAATAGKGARFTGWAGDALGTESQVTVLMNQNRSVQANFVSQVGLQIFIRGAGQVSGAGDQGMFPVGGTAALRAVPSSGWVLDEWSGAASGNSTDVSVLMDQPKTVTASFVMPVQAWKALYFTAPEYLNPSVSGNEVDCDGDGLENWKEYLHGSNPRDPSSRGTLQATTEGEFLSLIFTRLSGVEGSYRLTCEGSRNMEDWNSPDLQERILNTVNGIETVEVRMTRGGQRSGFIRFKYQQ